MFGAEDNFLQASSVAYIVVVKDAWADGEGSMGTASKKNMEVGSTEVTVAEVYPRKLEGVAESFISWHENTPDPASNGTDTHRRCQ